MEYYSDSFEVFNSVNEFIHAIDKYVPSDSYHRNKTAEDWTGNMTFEQCYNLTLSGDLSPVDKANAILEQVDSSICSNTLINRWNSAPVGAFPNVPAYLSNSPESMYSLNKVRDRRKSINIYYSSCVSAGVDQEEIVKRGTVILALTMQLSRIMDVNTYWITAYSRGNHIIRLNSPLVLSESAHVLSNPGFLRLLSFGYSSDKYNWDGSWASWYKFGKSFDATIEEFKKRLPIGENDIIIPPLDLKQWEESKLNNPVEYINELLRKYNG